MALCRRLVRGLSYSHGVMLRARWRYYSNAVFHDLLKLHERGVLQTLTPEDRSPELSRMMKSPQAVYCGFDPTRDSLHIGNLLAIIALIHCQRAGHRPLAVVGGATAQIGDPSGKTKDRDPMAVETVEANVDGVLETLQRIFQHHQQHIWSPTGKPLQPVLVLNNIDWYRDKNVVDFLSSVGRYFRMGSMLNKHSVKSRLASSEGLSFTEFTYQIFQSYDWLHLLQNYDCKVQLGGNDQLGNITAGCDFIGRTTSHTAYGLTVPLVTTEGGQKLGKTEGNALWLSPDKTTPYELYQHFISIADSEVEKYLKLFTFYSNDEIDSIVKKHKVQPEKRIAQKKLAEQITVLVHGAEGVKEAKKWTEAFWSNRPDSLLGLSEGDLQRLFQNAPTLSLLLEPGTSVLDLVMRAKCFNREVDAVRVIGEGGIYLNHQRVSEPDFVLVKGQHILPNNVTLLRTGKKNYRIIRWLE